MPYFAPSGGSPTSPVITANSQVRVIITRSYATGDTKFYLNGTQAGVTRSDTPNRYLSPSGWFYFFRDDGSEH